MKWKRKGGQFTPPIHTPIPNGIRAVFNEKKSQKTVITVILLSEPARAVLVGAPEFKY